MFWSMVALHKLLLQVYSHAKDKFSSQCSCGSTCESNENTGEEGFRFDSESTDRVEERSGSRSVTMMISDLMVCII